ncbi:MAG: hypothetical protein IJR08_04970 [Bacilli bacterium]|nr:hypothetical protein [Bacilli bacterium]
MYYIPQVTKSGCGFTCLKMLLATVRKDERYLYLPEDESHGPYSYQDLLEIAQRYEVTLTGLKYEDKSDLSHFKEFPLILTVQRENQSPHAVLATKIKGKRIKIFDPAIGTYWKSIDKFILEWDGTALAVNHMEDYPFTLRQVDAKDAKGEIVSYIFQALAAVFIALATFFVKPDGSFLLPLIFCAASLICEIILRMMLLKRMQKCDIYLRRFLPYVYRKDYYEFYKRGQEYKASALTMGLNFIFYFLVVILIVVVSLVNSLAYMVSIGIALICALAKTMVLFPYRKNVNQELTNQENDLRRVKEQEEMELKVKNLEVKSYRYAYYEFASKVVVGAFFLLSSFLICRIENSFTITNLVFYTCVSFLIYQYLVPLFSYDQKFSDNMVNKARINNLVHQNDEINSKRP